MVIQNIEYITDDAPVLASQVVCFDDAYVLMLGERKQCMDSFRKAFPNITNILVTPSSKRDEKKYKHLLGIIDIDYDYKFLAPKAYNAKRGKKK